MKLLKKTFLKTGLETFERVPHRVADGADLQPWRPAPLHLVLFVKDLSQHLHSYDDNIADMEKKKGKVKKENDKNAINMANCNKHRYSLKEVDQFRNLLLPW